MQSTQCSRDTKMWQSSMPLLSFSSVHITEGKEWSCRAPHFCAQSTKLQKSIKNSVTIRISWDMTVAWKSSTQMWDFITKPGDKHFLTPSVLQTMQLYITQKHMSKQKVFLMFFYKQPWNCAQHMVALHSPSQLNVPSHFSLSQLCCQLSAAAPIAKGCISKYQCWAVPSPCHT